MHRSFLRLSPFLLFAFITPASAATVMARSFEEMTRSVPVVVVGTVIRTRSTMERGRIFTFTEVRVEEAIKGKVIATVTVRQPGGEVGQLGQRVDGAATFALKERVLVFLEVPRDTNRVFVVSSMAAGKVRLEDTPLGVARAVRRLDGIELYRPGSTTPAIAHPLPKEDLGGADEFISRIRKAALASRSAQ